MTGPVLRATTGRLVFHQGHVIALAGAVELAERAAEYIVAHPDSDMARDFAAAMRSEDAPHALADLRPALVQAREAVQAIAQAAGVRLE